jgi:hypothetical protein
VLRLFSGKNLCRSSASRQFAISPHPEMGAVFALNGITPCNRRKTFDIHSICKSDATGVETSCLFMIKVTYFSYIYLSNEPVDVWNCGQVNVCTISFVKNAAVILRIFHNLKLDWTRVENWTKSYMKISILCAEVSQNRHKCTTSFISVCN